MRSGKNYRPIAKMFDSGERLKINPAAAKQIWVLLSAYEPNWERDGQRIAVTAI
jgi:hypothetical protein